MVMMIIIIRKLMMMMTITSWSSAEENRHESTSLSLSRLRIRAHRREKGENQVLSLSLCFRWDSIVRRAEEQQEILFNQKSITLCSLLFSLALFCSSIDCHYMNKTHAVFFLMLIVIHVGKWLLVLLTSSPRFLRISSWFDWTTTD